MELSILDNKRNALYDAAYGALGYDASPRDEVSDELACVESLSHIIQRAFPDLRFPTMFSTRVLYDYLEKSPSFVAVDSPYYGCIVLSVTGEGNGKIAHGHTGIIGKYDSPDGSPWIMSNDSRNGLWTVNYTLHAWRSYFEDRGGMATLYYRPI